MNPHTNDEAQDSLGQVEGSFEEADDSVEGAFEELIHSNKCAANNIEDRAQDALEDLDDGTDEIADAAHD